MTLLDYIRTTPPDEEITVWDSVYDMETYFYNSNRDDFEQAMLDLASKLNVVEVRDDGVVVDLYDLISRNVKNISDLFYEPDVDLIMDDMENILAGNVSVNWFIEFVNSLV